VVRNTVRAGAMPEGVEAAVEVHATPPSVNVRDPLQEARVDQIAYKHGVLSPQTWSQRLGLDYDQEQKNLRMDEEAKKTVGGQNRK